MVRRNRRRRISRALAVLLMGGSLLQLASCDPTVRSTILTGLESTSSTLLQTFVTAFFTGLQNNDGTTSLTTTP